MYITSNIIEEEIKGRIILKWFGNIMKREVTISDKEVVNWITLGSKENQNRHGGILNCMRDCQRDYVNKKLRKKKILSLVL